MEDYFAERKRERFLSDAELAALGEVLTAAEGEGENTSVIGALRLLILTGCRRDEILTLEWPHVDVANACLRLRILKPAPRWCRWAPALELLVRLPRVAGNPFVLPGAKRGRHYVGLEKAWYRLRERILTRSRSRISTK